MARVQISMPEGKPLAVLQIPVRITDINYGNHLGNDATVSIIHEARMQFLRRNNFTELNAGGTSLIMSDLAIQYKNEAYYGDVLMIEIFPADISRASFQLIYKVTANRNGKSLIIAIAATTMAGFDYGTKKVIPLSAELVAVLN